MVISGAIHYTIIIPESTTTLRIFRQPRPGLCTSLSILGGAQGRQDIRILPQLYLIFLFFSILHFGPSRELPEPYIPDGPGDYVSACPVGAKKLRVRVTQCPLPLNLTNHANRVFRKKIWRPLMLMKCASLYFLLSWTSTRTFFTKNPSILWHPVPTDPYLSDARWPIKI